LGFVGRRTQEDEKVFGCFSLIILDYMVRGPNYIRPLLIIIYSTSWVWNTQGVVVANFNLACVCLSVCLSVCMSVRCVFDRLGLVKFLSFLAISSPFLHLFENLSCQCFY
jgi:hypothetical protein